MQRLRIRALTCQPLADSETAAARLGHQQAMFSAQCLPKLNREEQQGRLRITTTKGENESVECRPPLPCKESATATTTLMRATTVIDRSIDRSGLQELKAEEMLRRTSPLQPIRSAYLYGRAPYLQPKC